MDIKRNEVRNFLLNHKDFCGVTYIKKDGSRRTAFALFHTKNIPVKGVGMTAAEKFANYNIIQYYDMNKQAFRSFSADRVESIAVNGETYKVID